MTLLETSTPGQSTGELIQPSTTEHLGAVVIEASVEVQPVETNTGTKRKGLDYYTENYTQAYDIELMNRAKNGDEASFGEIFAHWFPIAARMAYYKTSGSRFAEDIASEAMFRAFKKIETIPDTSRGFAPWITTIVQNLALDHYKSSAYKRMVYVGDTSMNEDKPSLGRLDEQTTTQTTQIKALKELQKKMIEKKRGHQFDLIADRYLVVLTTEEVAEKLGVTEAVVKARVYRATRYALSLLRRMGYSEEIFAK